MAAQQDDYQIPVPNKNVEMSDISQLQGSEDSQDDGKDLADPNELQQVSKNAAAELANVEAQLKLL